MPPPGGRGCPVQNRGLHGMAGSSSTETRFRLASPKLRLEPVHIRSKKTEYPPAGTCPLVMEGGGRLTEQGTHSTYGQGVRDGGTGHPPGVQGSCAARAPGQGQPGLAQMWGPGGWPLPAIWGPPPLQATFDGSPDRVAIFLNQVISYVDLYGCFYLSPWL